MKPKDIGLAFLCLPFIATIYVCNEIVDQINTMGEKIQDPYSAGHDAMLGWLEKEKEAYKAWVRGL